MGLVVFLGALTFTGCGDKDFDDVVAEVRVEAQPIKLDGEQVVLTEVQIDCGVQNDLWEAPSGTGDHKVARLLAKGRDLKFFDDVMVTDSGGNVQMRGDVQVDLVAPFQIRDAEQGVKLVTGKVYAMLKHTCFNGQPLPMMGVRKGQFDANAPVQLRYVQDRGDWQFDRIIH